MSTFRTAYVYVRNTFAGILKETDAGYSFKYDIDYLQKKNSYSTMSEGSFATIRYYGTILLFKQISS